MQTKPIFKITKKLHKYDGYQAKPVWKQEKNMSTYYDYNTDSQGSIPLRNIEKWKRKFCI